MVKLSQIQYVRPQKEQVLQQLANFKTRFENAQSAEEFLQINDEGFEITAHQRKRMKQLMRKYSKKEKNK